MPRPTLAVMLAGQQAVDQLLVGIRRGIVDERFHFVRLRRQAPHVEIGAADERAAAGFVVGGQAFRFQRRENESINIGANPRRVLHHWRRDDLQRLQRPELPPRLDINFFLRQFDCFTVARIGRADLDPFHKVGNRLGRQLRIRRHLERLVPQGGDQQTRLHVAGNYRRPALAAGADGVARVEQQLALQLVVIHRLGRVTLVTAFDEHGANLRLEERHAVGARLCGIRRQRRQ